MAVTKGHGNPNWSRDEVILALDLYLSCQGSIPSKTDARVVELSKVLNSLPLHVEARKNQAFRNPDGVAFKLQNIRQVATGKGLGNTSAVDRAVWTDLGSDPILVAEIAARIRSSIGETLPHPEDEETFREGRTSLRCTYSVNATLSLGNEFWRRHVAGVYPAMHVGRGQKPNNLNLSPPHSRYTTSNRSRR